MTYDELKMDFHSPKSMHRSLPFWAWNDMLSSEELVRQINLMKEQGVGGFFMHSREGLETEYLSDEWFKHIRTCVDAAKENDMEAWLYDEDRWPSGTAGGKVTKEGGDESRCKGLTLEVTKNLPAEGENFLAVYTATISGMELFEFKKFDMESYDSTTPFFLNENEFFLLCRIEVSDKSEWFNNEAPPDNLNPDSVARFIQTTHEAYKSKIGDGFGNTVKGIFTDEPGLNDTHAKFNPNRGWVPWTYIFKEYFKEKRGYDLFDHVPLIFFNSAGSSAVRHDYWYTVTELFVESYSKQISEWCEQNNIFFTGHFLQEDKLGLAARVGGAVMPHYVYQHVPGIDLLREQTDEFLTVKQCTSVANQYNKPWVISETYGCTGWNFTFESQRWIGDWQFVLGVNRRCQHLALYSIRGCRKRDYPPSFNYNTSWWKYNHIIEEYYARLSSVLSKGRAIRELLILHPATTAWSMLGASPYGVPMRRYERDIPAINNYGSQFNSFLKFILDMHYDFDLGDELIIKKEASVKEGIFKIKECSYKVLIIPPLKTMLRSTYNLLIEFLDAGGKVIALKPFASMLDGRVSPELDKLFKHKNITAANDYSEVGKALYETNIKTVSIQNEYKQETVGIYYMLKELDVENKLRALFIVNNNQYQGHAVEIKLSFLGYVEEWDLLTGKVYVANYSHNDGFTKIITDLNAAASKLYIIKKELSPEHKQIEPMINYSQLVFYTSLGPVFKYRRNSPNALVLDKCCYRLGDTEFSNEMQLWQAQKEIREFLGMRQIYYNGLPQRYKWVRTFHSGNGVRTEFKFQFNVTHLPDENISLAIENSENFDIYLNSVLAEKSNQEYFIDKCINIVNLKGIKTGLNTLLLSCDYKNEMELEDCYIIGNFGVDTAGSITKEPQNLRLGDWCLQGFIHYAGGIIYEAEADLEVSSGKRYFITVQEFSAVIIEIKVNGITAGYIPWKHADALEITDYLKEGANFFELVVMGSPRNIFGPFHLKEGNPNSINWASFRSEDSKYTPEYNLQHYGLYDLVRIYYLKD